MKSRHLASVFLLGIGIVTLFVMKMQQSCIIRWKKSAQKNRALFMLMNQWTNVKQEGKNLETYFKRNNYKRIAVYGMSYAGCRLVKELKDSKIEIVYAIDRNAENIYSKVRIVTMEEKLENVDAVVVTLTEGFDEIYDALSMRLGCPVLSIEDVLNEI